MPSKERLDKYRLDCFAKHVGCEYVIKGILIQSQGLIWIMEGLFYFADPKTWDSIILLFMGNYSARSITKFVSNLCGFGSENILHVLKDCYRSLKLSLIFCRFNARLYMTAFLWGCEGSVTILLYCLGSKEFRAPIQKRAGRFMPVKGILQARPSL